MTDGRMGRVTRDTCDAHVCTWAAGRIGQSKVTIDVDVRSRGGFLQTVSCIQLYINVQSIQMYTTLDSVIDAYGI